MKQVALIRIVDDDPSVGASFRFVLEAVGYQVRTYESAAEFLDGDDPTREGCMLLDVRMPGLSGPELQTRLAEMKCDLPIIFLTAHGEVRMAVEAVQAGALDFLEKPVDAEALLPLLARGCELHRRRRAVARDLKRAEVLWNELMRNGGRQSLSPRGSPTGRRLKFWAFRRTPSEAEGRQCSESVSFTMQQNSLSFCMTWGSSELRHTGGGRQNEEADFVRGERACHDDSYPCERVFVRGRRI